MKNVFIYCGINKGKEFEQIINENNFDYCFGFEAIPSLAKLCEENLSKYKNVKIVNKALLDHDGKTSFYVYDRDASSSIAPLTENWKSFWYKRRQKKFNLKQKIEVDCINLYNWILSSGIEEISYLVTDLQGVDFTVLKTLRPLLESKKILKLRCEVENDDILQYENLNVNKFSLFKEFFKDLDYKRIEGYKENWDFKKDGSSADIVWRVK